MRRGFHPYILAITLSVITLFLGFPSAAAAATTKPDEESTTGESTLYTYNTNCGSPALRTKQGFIIPVGLGTVDNLYLHLHGSENPEASTLCNLKPGHGLCDAASMLNKKNIRAAIILSMENSGDTQLTQEQRVCVLNEAREKISTITTLVPSAGYTITAQGSGSAKALKFLEQGFVAKKTILFGGCLDDNCAKISKFQDSGQVLIYAGPTDLAQTVTAYQNNPEKIFALSLPLITNNTDITPFCYLDHVLGNKCNNNAKPIVIPLATKYGIGESCTATITDSDCKNKLDCEDSSIDGDDNFCVCENNQQCADAYGNPGNTTELWECIDGTGEDKSYKLHYCKSNTGKVFYPIQQEESFKDGDGTLLGDLTRGFNAAPMTEEQLVALLQKPNPKIRIPGLTFTDLTASGKLSSDEDGSTYLEVPYLGEYMGAVYNYLILIAGVICVARIMLAGFIYTSPDSSGEAKSSAIKMIQSAVIGLLLAVGSYTILYLFNPELVEFKNLKVFYTRGEPYFEPAELPQTKAGGYVVGTAAVSVEAGSSVGSLLGDLAGGKISSSPCSAATAQAAAQSLHTKKICVGPVHCAYTATRFLQFIGCNQKTLTGNANYMVGNMEQEGWVSMEITPNNADNLPVGALWFPGHAGVSTGGGNMFESTIGGAFNYAADGKGCPPISGNASQANCGYCAKLKGQEPWQKNIFYKNGEGKNQGWKVSGVKNIKQFRLVIYPAAANVARPPLGCCKFSGGKQNLSSKLFCEQIHIKKDGRGKITSNDWTETLWDKNRNTTTNCPSK